MEYQSSVFQQTLAGRRGSHTPLVTIEQCGLDGFLELCNSVAHRRWRGVLALRRLGNALLSTDRNKQRKGGGIETTNQHRFPAPHWPFRPLKMQADPLS